MTKANELLRSAYAIADRDGKNTNWEAFRNQLRKELLTQAGVKKTYDTEILKRATCTAKTYFLKLSWSDKLYSWLGF